MEQAKSGDTIRYWDKDLERYLEGKVSFVTPNGEVMIGGVVSIIPSENYFFHIPSYTIVNPTN